MDWGENFRFGRKFWVGAKILGSGENFRFGQKFWVEAKILGLSENFGLGQNFLVGAKILGLGDSIQVCFLVVLLARLIREDISPSSKSYAHNVYVFAGGRGVVITYCVMVLLLISQSIRTPPPTYIFTTAVFCPQ